MKKYNILVIDDDDPIHFMAKGLLGREYKLFNAKNAQEAIDVLSTNEINLIISDIHMPGLTGLELLESLRADDEKKHIPVLIMTNLPTVDKERKAMELGAADFFKKELFNNNRERILELVRMKLVTNIQVPGLQTDLEMSKEQLVMELMESALEGDFDDTINVLVSDLSAITKSVFSGFWKIDGDNSKRIIYRTSTDIDISKFNDINNEYALQEVQKSQKGYIVNHIGKEQLGTFKEASKEYELNSEIAVPICKVNEKDLLSNNLELPKSSDLFGLIIFKRKVLFSTLEFELVSRLITQTGSILWRLYQRNN